MSVISTAFDPDFFDESLMESDRIESSCKRKCSKKNHETKMKDIYLIDLRMRYEYLSTCLRFS